MDSFLTACGATGPLYLEVEGPGFQGTERRAFAAPFVLIGRDDRADLILDHDLVSRRHAYLQVIEGRVFFVDLESRSGTLAQYGATEGGWLEPEESIAIGPFTVRLVGAEDTGFEFHAEGGPGLPALPQNPLLARSSESADLPRIALEFQSKTAGHSVWRMSQILAIVGSSSKCKVRLLESNVSKLHCALLRSSEGLWVIDLLGRGGITVNGNPVPFARLGAGDVLGLGQVVVRPNFEDPFTRSQDPSRAVRLWGNLPAIPGGASQSPASSNFMERAPRAWRQPAQPRHQGPSPPPVPTEFSPNDPSLALLLNHFGQMQQQMIDQFQSSMMMMMQMFSGIHREQMGLVREELDRLRELSGEVEQIKAKLGDGIPKEPRPGSTHGPASDPPLSHWPQQPRSSVGWSNSSAVGSPSHGNSPAQPRNKPPHGTNPFAPRTQPRGSHSNGSGRGGENGPPIAPLSSPYSSSDSDAEVHDWLSDRLTAITQEQQGRWQKIMSILRGQK